MSADKQSYTWGPIPQPLDDASFWTFAQWAVVERLDPRFGCGTHGELVVGAVMAPDRITPLGAGIRFTPT